MRSNLHHTVHQCLVILTLIVSIASLNYGIVVLTLSVLLSY